MKKIKSYKLITTTIICFFSCNIQRANAVIFGGIDFPQGASSFADSVIRYEPLFTGGPGPTSSNFINPNSAIGIPDDFANPAGSVSLGRGGLIELLFTDNILTNSGNSDFDLHVFEIGPDVEDTFVAIRPTATTVDLLNPLGDSNGDGFFEIGKVLGSTSSIDIDSFFTGFSAGELKFDAVQLIDDRNEGNSSGPTVGADIDAVGAISSESIEPTSTPEPSLIISFLSLGILSAISKNRLNK